MANSSKRPTLNAQRPMSNAESEKIRLMWGQRFAFNEHLNQVKH